ncbi:zwei Ig domain protein zig-8-like isoform X2 [Parasteatoda tepidariorum]|uniref:zwei Ig domain protein zig-8-like isoform X2 n=1 Tax=Parasteatoda tepidariorum TaxID=114398 RepID=UPI001C71C8BC|nr:opioid-binding protein/cell adhesion molecule homolog isoform X2 [Parasteatoda tepidariorum]
MIVNKVSDIMLHGFKTKCESNQCCSFLSRDKKVRAVSSAGNRPGFIIRPNLKFQALLLLFMYGLQTFNVGHAASVSNEFGSDVYLRHSRQLFTSDKPKGFAPPARVSDYWTLLSHVTPSFDNTSPKNMTTQLGQTVYLHCVVNNLGDKTVSWIRRRDFHVLTVGLDTYTTDDRFEAIHMEKKNDWTLKIKFAQLWDEGLYECQVSSDPKISLFVNLSIVVAKATILGPHPLFLKTGSSINLTCVITQSPEPPVFVFWYHDDRMINYDSSRGEISMYKSSEDSTTSRLFIKDATAEDSGNYTCCPSNTQATSIPVYVLNGERPAAIQHDANISTSSSSSPSFSVLFFLVLTAMVTR